MQIYLAKSTYYGLFKKKPKGQLVFNVSRGTWFGGLDSLILVSDEEFEPITGFLVPFMCGARIRINIFEKKKKKEKKRKRKKKRAKERLTHG